MEVTTPRFLPDPELSREEMEDLQRAIADAATFSDDLHFDPATVGVRGPVEGGPPADVSDSDGSRQTTLGAAESVAGSEASGPSEASDRAAEAPLVAGVDQAFLDDRAVSAVVVLRDGEVVERAGAVTALEIPYIPGLLAFREGRPIVAALETLSVDPDLLVVDGSGRIHFRQAGIATHVGVLFDVPAVGVAKSLLCGRPETSLEEPLTEGVRVPILSDGRVDAPDGTVLGHAFQSRQYDSPNRHVNPLYVSPGHRVGAETATDFVAAYSAGYKLPEPTRLADAYAETLKRENDR